MDSRNGQNGKERAVKLFDYLLKLVDLRTTKGFNYEDNKNILWFSDISDVKNCFTQVLGQTEENEDSIWIEIERKREPKVPPVPSECKDWVDKATLEKTDELPELRKEIIRQIPNSNWTKESDLPKKISQTLKLEDDPKINKLWNKYFDEKWWPWKEDHDDWMKINEIYHTLYAIHQEQMRSSEITELVLGLGFLTWKTPSGKSVKSHLIVADANLEFDAEKAKFVVGPHPRGAKLRIELDMPPEDRPLEAEREAQNILDKAEDDPCKKDCIESALKNLVNSINEKGEYEGAIDKKNLTATDKPVVKYAPALILRNRSTKGLIKVLEKIKEQVGDGGSIPGVAKKLLEIPVENRWDSENKRDYTGPQDDEKIYFPKPSNELQRKIIRQLKRSDGVLVQGPPGTGKSHTIANLICHLLATGQRMLITAKTPRALEVLYGLIPSELQPLCISLLGSNKGVQERESLEYSVDGIKNKKDEWDDDKEKESCKLIEKRLKELREQQNKINLQLKDIRESETRNDNVVVEGKYFGTPAGIVGCVERDRKKYEWFKDETDLYKSCPVSVDDLVKLRCLLCKFTPEKRDILSLALPASLVSIEDFHNLIKSSVDINEELKYIPKTADQQLAQQLAHNDEQTIEKLKEALSSFQTELRKLRAIPDSWFSKALSDILTDQPREWEDLLSCTSEAIESVDKFVKSADDTRVDAPDQCDYSKLLEDAKVLRKHIEDGGNIGSWLYRPKPVSERKYILKTVKVNGSLCSSLEHFTLLVEAVFVKIELEKLWKHWEEHINEVKSTYESQLSKLKNMCDQLKRILALRQKIAECQRIIMECENINDPLWSDDSEIEKIITSSQLAIIKKCEKHIKDKFEEVEQPVLLTTNKKNAYPEVKELLDAIRDKDLEKFRKYSESIQLLQKEREELEVSDKLTSLLRDQLPRLTESLEKTCNEDIWEERIPGIEDAWHWSQARYWVEDYINKENTPGLEQKAKQIQSDINSCIESLSANLAWTFCFSRLTEDHQRYMEDWQQSMKRLGKGTGKHAPHHRREAQASLNKCIDAVPAWIMPLHRVWDTVSPASGMFDVIIVDEASQCGQEGVPLFFLAKKILIVGDDKQISPYDVGIGGDELNQLKNEYLRDFEHKQCFDYVSSLFDQGKSLFTNGKITLREHFRCMPEIIRFSNDNFYFSTPLIPLRQYGPDRIPPLEHFFVEEGYREGNQSGVRNEPEAEKLVQKICDMCNNEQYNGKTMGVITLQGKAQAGLIENMLLDKLGANEMGKRRLVCGDPYSFQGDERDIIFLSLVAATNEKIGPLTKEEDKRRFNVAASRARDSMLLFHSVRRQDLNKDDLRCKLIEFFECTKPREIAGIDLNDLECMAAEENRSVVKAPVPFDSWFEVDVALQLLRKGYRVIPQYEVAGKYIDLVVEGGQARLAVECDGDYWHGPDAYESDMDRQRQLERCGWEFFRVRQSEFYWDKEKSLDKLWKLLEDRNILPESRQQPVEAKKPTDLNEPDESNDECVFFEDDESSPDLPDDKPDEGVHRLDEMAAAQIDSEIRSVLKRCPNYTCPEKDIGTKVLQSLGKLTRGEPRKKFVRRVESRVNSLVKNKIVERYKVKNVRLRLLVVESTD